MPTRFTHITCLSCGHEMPPLVMTDTCSVCGGGWLDAGYDYSKLNWPSGLVKRLTSLWRYADLLPFDDTSKRVSMGEGWTPLYRASGLEEALGHNNLFIKDERQGPTGSFKDRQGAVSVTALRQAGIRECVLASTGNAAAAYAAYCARAGIKLWVFLTSMVPAEKMRELALYGAEVVKVTSTYDQAKKVAADFAARRSLYFDRGAKGIPGKESMKTLAYEIAEQLGLEQTDGGRWIAPDWYLQAVSGGIGPLGVLKGFEELYRMDMVDKVPKLAVVQSEGCSPMVQAFEQGLAVAKPVTPATRITVLATGDPGHGYTMLRQAIMSYGGAMTSVDDGQAFRAMRRVARTEGLSVEPATAVAFAGLEKLIALGTISADETVLINCSGHTFPAEKHILEDQYILELELGSAAPLHQEGLTAALERLDEQIKTVVVIDDNPQDSRLIRRLLQTHKNYRVFEANNPVDGLDLVRQRRPDLVITDLTMPDLDGFTLLEKLKDNPETAHIPLMVLSGLSLSQAEKARLYGRIDSMWTKGNFETHDLVNHVVNTLTDQSAMASETELPIEETDVLLKILIVDDNPYDSRMVRRMLEADRMFEVSEVRTGDAALQAISTWKPDFVILDLVLPDMSGFDVLAKLRDMRHEIPVKVAVLSSKELTKSESNLLGNAVFWHKGSLDHRTLVEAVKTAFAT
jgi:threonine synthase